jgi:hypothetical protein
METANTGISILPPVAFALPWVARPLLGATWPYMTLRLPGRNQPAAAAE